jgi:hypothetical protein
MTPWLLPNSHPLRVPLIVALTSSRGRRSETGFVADFARRILRRLMKIRSDSISSSSSLSSSSSVLISISPSSSFGGSHD